jgi:hypothetical protein
VVTILAAAALGVMALPSLAMAQGNSGVDEYEEVLPSPGGGSDSDSDSGESGADESSGPLTSEQVAALEEEGADGEAAAAVAQANGADRDPESGGDPASPTSTAPADDSGVAEVVGDLASGSDDGMGIMLPIVLVVAALAAIAFFAARRSRGRTGKA